MRGGSEAAWAKYDACYRPVLEAYARRARIPAWEWPTCVSEVLADEGLRLTRASVAAPLNLPAYLVSAVRHRYLRLKRDDVCRQRNYAAAVEDWRGESVVTAVCSQDALRRSRGDTETASASETLRRFATELCRDLTDEDRRLLVWVGERVSHVEIARWMGISYDACTKRIWRLCRRLRSEAKAKRELYTAAEQREIDRLLGAHPVMARPCRRGGEADP